MPIDELIREKREEILAIAAQHGASNVRIFGSVARGEAREDSREDSDVDFLVEIAPDRSLLNRIALVQSLEDLLKRKVDVVKLENLHERIRDRVIQEAIPL